MSALVLASLNDALNTIGIRVSAPAGDPAAGDWSISDGRALTRFHDGVVLPAKAPQHAARGPALLAAFQSPNRALAAAATAASNAAATASGLIPPTGFVPPGRRGATRPPAQASTTVAVAANGSGGAAAGGSGSVFSRLGGGAGKEGEDDRTRRLRSQGRYQPY